MALVFLILFVMLIKIRCVRPQQQDFLDVAYSNQEDDSSNKMSVAGASNHPYVGIPVTTWKIINLNITEREGVCADQLQFCATECGGEQMVTKNFCNKATMGWGCNCQNHVPDIPPYGWPVAIAECKGKEAACKQRCTYGTTQEVCLKGCIRYFKCEKPGGPKTGLRVENENQLPDYDLPVADDGNDASSAIPLLCRESVVLIYCWTVIFVLLSLLL